MAVYTNKSYISNIINKDNSEDLTPLFISSVQYLPERNRYQTIGPPNCNVILLL